MTNPSKFAVIGDSALSHPEAPDKSGVPQGIPVGSNGWDRGFADVGVRLAFTAPEENLAVRLKTLAETLCMPPPGQ